MATMVQMMKAVLAGQASTHAGVEMTADGGDDEFCNVNAFNDQTQQFLYDASDEMEGVKSQ